MINLSVLITCLQDNLLELQEKLHVNHFLELSSEEVNFYSRYEVSIQHFSWRILIWCTIKFSCLIYKEMYGSRNGDLLLRSWQVDRIKLLFHSPLLTYHSICYGFPVLAFSLQFWNLTLQSFHLHGIFNAVSRVMPLSTSKIVTIFLMKSSNFF